MRALSASSCAGVVAATAPAVVGRNRVAGGVGIDAEGVGTEMEIGTDAAVAGARSAIQAASASSEDSFSSNWRNVIFSAKVENNCCATCVRKRESKPSSRKLVAGGLAAGPRPEE